MAPTVIRYVAEGWGIGELWLEAEQLVWHELPRPGDGAPSGAHELAERLQAYFAGDPVAFDDVEIDLEDETEFGQKLALALRAIPSREVVTYGELAALAGRPGAARAAGSFCARNRLPIIIPCHRVVSASGLGPYGSLGQGYKRRLLEHEGVRF